MKLKLQAIPVSSRFLYVIDDVLHCMQEYI